MRVELPSPPLTTPARTTARLVLAGATIFAGLSHLFWGREEFKTPVPTSVPMDADGVGMATGGVEIALGVGLALLTPTGGVLRGGVPRQHRAIPQPRRRLRAQQRDRAAYAFAVSAGGGGVVAVFDSGYEVSSLTVSSSALTAIP